MISGPHAVNEPPEPGLTVSGSALEPRPARTLPGLAATAVAVAVDAIAIVLIVVGSTGNTRALTIVGVVLLVVLSALFSGLFVIQPNESRVMVLFGRYVGTVSQAGWWWCNPFIKRRTVSLRVRNFQSERIKVNASSDNPIEIAAVVVWRVADSAKAVFDVEDYERFVTVQSETSLRHIANHYPYDDYKPNSISLRTNAGEVQESLQAELQARLRVAGIEILETRLTHLAYAPEIAEVMLRRQQAEAILAARKTMVQGAVGLVQMAVAQLTDSDLIDIDAERKATMAAKLMVVLSGDHSRTPVINTGSLYT